MNSKTAKVLRKIAGYRNQTATPGVMDFPGVARAIQFPVFHSYLAVKTSYKKLPGEKTYTKVFQSKRVYTKQPVLGTDGLPKFEMVPTSNPGLLRKTEAKGIYRRMKKIVAKHGATPLYDFVKQVEA